MASCVQEVVVVKNALVVCDTVGQSDMVSLCSILTAVWCIQVQDLGRCMTLRNIVPEQPGCIRVPTFRV
jgi:hypothetical protein